jgi:hypothetical protein
MSEINKEEIIKQIDEFQERMKALEKKVEDLKVHIQINNAMFDEVIDLANKQLQNAGERTINEYPGLFLQMIEQLSGKFEKEIYTQEMILALWNHIPDENKTIILNKLRTNTPFF